MDDDPTLPSADDYRASADRARATAQSRCRTHLAKTLSRCGIDDASEVVETAMAALFHWTDVETGERCRCHCHPQLPETNLHDFGASCRCTRTAEQRRASSDQALNAIREYWQSPESQQLQAASHLAEQELHAWLAQHPGVIVGSHGGLAPEQWTGQVDGHSFYFRERYDDWHLEIDVRPTGHVVDPFAGRKDDGTTRRQTRLIERGEIIATGTTYTDNYGTTPTERAQFIVATIRDHLARQACTHYVDQLDSVQRLLRTPVRWGPACGIRLAAT